MPIIQVQILEGRTDEQVKELIKDLTTSTVKCLGVRADQVRVVVNEVPKKFWGVGGITKDEL
ncbi:4-oxalocrotonate tautomerase [Neobacillus sp. D3-1R]|uniref:4-oxalocrotonate tautomerase n=1 Tax=Neobacillus sp. D3-1R TaxID=3445778 RepID=UPI003F9F0A15